jgi:hypothetical protein
MTDENKPDQPDYPQFIAEPKQTNYSTNSVSDFNINSPMLRRDISSLLAADNYIVSPLILGDFDEFFQPEVTLFCRKL